MIVALITLFTPMPENVRGISALEYFLIKHRPKDVELTIFTINLNNIGDADMRRMEKELQADIRLIKPGRWARLINGSRLLSQLFRYLSPLRLLSLYAPDAKALREVDELHPDLVWEYPGEMFSAVNILKDYRHICSDVDCIGNSQLRSLLLPSSHRNVLKAFSMVYFAHKSLSYEMSVKEHTDVLHHFVGIDDLHLMHSFAPQRKAFFVRHPHYKIVANPAIDFGGKKIRLLLAGSNDMYMQDGIEDLLCGMSLLDEAYRSRFTLTFLGKKWESVSMRFEALGYECNIVTWVDDYVESIAEYDVQLSPISYGSGTKGKVLDALANGLLVIGTPIALENIAVKDGESCVEYRDWSQLPHILRGLADNPAEYESIARAGIDAVRKYHSPQRTGEEFWTIAREFQQTGEYVPANNE